MPRECDKDGIRTQSECQWGAIGMRLECILIVSWGMLWGMLLDSTVFPLEYNWDAFG